MSDEGELVGYVVALRADDGDVFICSKDTHSSFEEAVTEARHRSSVTGISDYLIAVVRVVGSVDA